MKGTVRLNSLDGPREREFDLPANWRNLTEEEQEAIWRPVKEALMDDTVDYSVSIPCHCCDGACTEDDCWCEAD